MAISDVMGFAKSSTHPTGYKAVSIPHAMVGRRTINIDPHLSGELADGTRIVKVDAQDVGDVKASGIVGRLRALYVAPRDLTRIIALCIGNQHKDPVRDIVFFCP